MLVTRRRVAYALCPLVAVGMMAGALDARALDIRSGRTELLRPQPDAGVEDGRALLALSADDPIEVPLLVSTSARNGEIDIVVNGRRVGAPEGRGVRRTRALTTADGVRLGENTIEVRTRLGGRVVDHDRVEVRLARLVRGLADARVSVRAPEGSSPASVRLEMREDARIRKVWLNGRRVDDVLRIEASAGPFDDDRRAHVAELSPVEGLRPGDNTLRVVVTWRGATEIRDIPVEVPGGLPIPAVGGPASVRIGSPALLETGPPGLGAGPPAIIDAPEGSVAAIADPTSPSPTFVPDRPGRYELRADVPGVPEAGRDTATVCAHPGWRVPFSAAPGRVRIDGHDHVDAAEYAFDPETLERRSSASPPPGSIVVAPPTPTGAGSVRVADSAQSPGRSLPPGTETTGALVPVGGPPCAGGRYTFSYGDHVPFQTRAGDIEGGAKGITIGGIQRATPGAGAGGVQIVVLESTDDPLDPKSLLARTFATNQDDPAAALDAQRGLAVAFTQILGEGFERPLVFMQTYGAPIGDSAETGALSEIRTAVEDIGGNGTTFVRSIEPGSARGYSVVGIQEPSTPAFAAEASRDIFAGGERSGAAENGGLSGVLSRDSRAGARPVVWDGLGAYSYSLLSVIHQPAGDWPELAREETAAARYLMWRSVAPSRPTNPYAEGDFRGAYQTGGDWSPRLATLEALAWSADTGFSEPAFETAKAQLAAEFRAVAALDTLLQNAARALLGDEPASATALEAAAANVERELRVPANGEAALQAFEMARAFANTISRVAASSPDSVSAASGLGLISALMAAGIDVSADPDGEARRLGPRFAIDAEVATLGQDAGDLLASDVEQFDVWRSVIVSDWGRLRAVVENAASGGPWEWTDAMADRVVDDVSAAAEEWFYGALVPGQFEAYSLGTFPLSGPFGPIEDTRCLVADGTSNPPEYASDTFFPVEPGEPTPYYRRVHGYAELGADGALASVPEWWFLTRPFTPPINVEFLERPDLPGSRLTRVLFGGDRREGQLGLYKPWFFERNLAPPDTTMTGELDGTRFCTSPGPG